MIQPAAGTCRRAECTKPIPSSLVNKSLCLDHFLEEAFLRTDQTFGRCREGQAVTPGDVEWMLADALAVVESLEQEEAEPDPIQRDRMLELLLTVATLHEYVAQHPERPGWLA